MGLTDRIANWLAPPASAPAQRVAASPLAVRGTLDPSRLPDWMGAWADNRVADWAPWDDRSRLADNIRKCTAVFACATFLADAVAESPLEVYRLVDGEKEPADDRIGTLCRDLLTSPNPYTSQTEFFISLVLGMCVWGYGVVEKVRARGSLDLPVQLWTLRPDWLVRRRRTDSADGYWEYPKPDRGLRQIEDRDILIVPYYPDPWRGSYGISPAQVAARDVGIDSSLTDFLKTFLDAGGIPPFVLTHPDPIWDPAVVEAMQEQWRQKYGGAKAYGSLPVLHGGYDIKPVGSAVGEMAWPDLRGLTEQKIAQAHRVPLELIQGQIALQQKQLTTTQFEGAMQVLQRHGAAPLRGRIDGVFARGVLAEFTGGDGSYDLAFDTSGVLALQEDQDAVHTRVRADYQAGLITLDEARQDLGMDPLPKDQGNVFAIGIGVTLTPADALYDATPTTTTTPPPALPADTGTTTTTPAPAKSARVYRDTKALSPREIEVRASALARTHKDRRRLEEIGGRALRTFWKEQGQRIVGHVTGRSSPVDVRVAERIDWSEEEKALAVVLMRFYNLSGETAFKAIADQLDVTIDWTLANPNIQRVVSDLAKRIVAIAETTRTDVAQVVGDALKEGVTTQQLADRLTGLFTETYRNRSLAVARTESMVAYNRASVVGYRESGEVENVELADNSAHTEDYGASDGLTCAERDGLVVPLEQAQTHIDAEHPNGSLALIPLLSTPLGEE